MIAHRVTFGLPMLHPVRAFLFTNDHDKGVTIVVMSPPHDRHGTRTPRTPFATPAGGIRPVDEEILKLLNDLLKDWAMYLRVRFVLLQWTTKQISGKFRKSPKSEALERTPAACEQGDVRGFC